GEVGDDIFFTVPLGKFYAADLTTATNLATAYRDQMGQSIANQGTCYLNCPFSWDQSLGGFTSSAKVTGGVHNTVNFSFNWTYPTSSYTGGTLGTITGGCLPSVTRTVNVTNTVSGSSWSVTITPSGTVTATQHTGPTGVAGQQIKLSSSFNL